MNVESVQFVFFMMPGQPMPEPFSLWNVVASGMPNNFQKTSPDSSQYSMEGELNGNKFMLLVSPARIDLIFIAENIPTQVPVIRDFDSAIEVVKEVSAKLSRTFPALRLGVTIRYVQEFKSQTEANLAFVGLTGLDKLAQNSSDLSFSVNVEKVVLDGDFTINRVVQWATQNRQIIEFNVGSSIETVQTVLNKFVLTTSVDANTKLTDIRSCIPSEKVISVIDTLIDSAKSVNGVKYANL